MHCARHAWRRLPVVMRDGSLFHTINGWKSSLHICSISITIHFQILHRIERSVWRRGERETRAPVSEREMIRQKKRKIFFFFIALKTVDADRNDLDI